MPKANFYEIPYHDKPAMHGGEGVCRGATVLAKTDFQAPIRFLNATVLPAGASIGPHKHGADNEMYIILEGEGAYEQDGAPFSATPGSVFVNPANGTHALKNTGNSDMRILVIEVACAPAHIYDEKEF